MDVDLDAVLDADADTDVVFKDPAQVKTNLAERINVWSKQVSFKYIKFK